VEGKKTSTDSLENASFWIIATVWSGGWVILISTVVLLWRKVNII